MRSKFVFLLLIVVLLLAGMAAADDGAIFRRNVSRTPDMETDAAQISMMYLYVPAQGADGTLGVPIEYYLDTDGDNQGDTLYDTRDYAKPIIATYIDEVETADADASALAPLSGVTFGAFDTFGAVSLDDGATWKEFNVSRAADRSSFTLADGHAYPGSSGSAVHAVSGDRVMVAWTSKYCAEGKPNYTLTVEEIEALKVAYPDLDPLYFDLIEDGETVDLFGVMGTQQSVDYTLQGFPEVGEIPYSCVWTARGSLEYLDDGTFDVIWYKAERLTSGRRDANRIEIDTVPGVGFAIMWQEDPEGLRPGQGLGPGEGWSGAIVNSKTDIWYSYVPWDVFELVDVDNVTGTTEDIVPIEEYVLTGDEPMPKPAVPMAMPIRLTDNDMCKEGSLAQPEYPYCFYDFETGTYYAEQNAASDLCAEIVEWTNPGGTTLRVCQTEDGRVLTGRIGASRPRFDMWPRDTDGDGVPESAWVVMAYEETKALGEGMLEEDLEPIDIGKNIWYHSFDMLAPDLVAQGGMLNQPAIDRDTGLFYELLEDDWGNPFYETEIGRRFSSISQPVENVGASGTLAFTLFKQGIINQGGPADILARRIVLPDEFDPAVDNPYAFENMECDTWEYADGSNPYYLQGICLDPPVNISGTNIEECDNGSSGADCADAFPWDPKEDLGGDQTFPKVIVWSQDMENVDDQSWENPYDVAKGHRGFIDGDFLMVIYAWSPNWQANSVGNDHYNLYARRSFDGGQTWTTTPAELGGAGIETCEYYYTGGTIGQAEEVCSTYAAGAFEQARNVSKLTGNRETILDPRYTPTGGLNLVNEIKCFSTGTEGEDVWTADACNALGLPYWDDLERDPSKYFLVFETGDNTTVAEGEATPLDLFYSRGTVYGDFYDEVEYYAEGSGGETYLYWDWLEKNADDLSGEAALTANLGGTFLYAIWNQWNEYEEEVITNSDAWFRRLLYVDDEDALPTATILYVSHTTASTSAGDTLTFVGTAQDNDHMGAGIVAYEWQSDLKGVLSTEKYFTITAVDLGLGLHYITFRAQDDEGNWSAPAQIRVRVVDKYLIFLPQVSD